MKVAAGRMMVSFEEQGKSMSGNLRADADRLMEVFGSHLDKESQIVVRDGIKKYMILHGHDSKKDPKETESLPGLPPLGGRVVRGEDWKWNNQDTEGPGTVIEHLHGGTVVVVWDNGHTDRYRYGDEGAYDVKVVHDQPKENTSNSSIDAGCEVVRGPDWEAKSDEDGGEGSVGVVISDGFLGVLRVRWYDNGIIKTYRFGKEGKYDVMLRDITETRATTTKASQEKSLDKALEKSQEKSQARSLDASPDTVQRKSPEQEFVWQWQDDGVTWRSYSQETCLKLEASFNRRPTGSCLVKRDKISCRILFREMEEKCLDDNMRRKVQRTKNPE